MTISRRLGIAIIALLATCGIAGGFALRTVDGDIPQGLRGIVIGNPVPVENVTLQVAAGDRVFPSGTAGGKWTILAIGFTHCPEICPFMLSNLAAVEESMVGGLPAADLPQVVFLSVDPDRDDAAMLGEYVGYFSDRFIGATGSRAAIDRLTGAIGAFYRLGDKDADGNYNVDHSAEVYLIDPAGRLFARFRPPLDPEGMTAQYRDILKLQRERQS